MQKNKPQPAQLVALVTGASRRIGAAIARTLHASGINVVLHYHTSKEDAHTLCASLNTLRPDSAALICGDLGDINQLDGLITAAVQKWGRLDVLVNNASRFYRTPCGTTTSQAWDDLLTANLKAPFFLAQSAAPFLKQTQGCIINIADIHGDRPMRDYSVYCVSKAGLIMLTKALAKEWGGDIRVNAIAPGQMIFPEGENALTEAVKQKITSRTVMDKIGNPEEIAQVVLFFIQGANYITGQVLAVDGGRSLTI